MNNEFDLNALRRLVGLPEQVSEEQTVTEEKCEECGMDPCACDHVAESKVDEAEVEEGNAYTAALAKAKEEGKDEFEVDGKKHEVKEAAKPDFADIDGDGDKEEDMKKAAKDKEELDECGEMPMMSPMSSVGDTDAMAAMIAPNIAEPESAAMTQEPEEEPASYTLSIRNGDSTLNMTTDSPDEIIHVMKLAGVKGEATVKKGSTEQQPESEAKVDEWANSPDATREPNPTAHGDIRDWARKGTGANKGYPGTKASGDNPLSEESLIGEYKSFKF